MSIKEETKGVNPALNEEMLAVDPDPTNHQANKCSSGEITIEDEAWLKGKEGRKAWEELMKLSNRVVREGT